MGKVLSSFSHGFAGSIARALDDVVISLANKSGAVIPFGTAVVMNPSKEGIIPFNPASHTADQFVGITVRNPSKTPATYGSNAGSYAANELADVLVRGHIVVKMDTDSAKPSDPVSIRKSDSKFCVGTGDTVVTLNNVRVSGATDNYGLAEILLTGRNVL